MLYRIPKTFAISLYDTYLCESGAGSVRQNLISNVASLTSAYCLGVYFKSFLTIRLTNQTCFIIYYKDVGLSRADLSRLSEQTFITISSHKNFSEHHGNMGTWELMFIKVPACLEIRRYFYNN